MAAVIPADVVRRPDCLIAIEGGNTIGKSGYGVGKREGGRAPVYRLLIVARDACIPRYVFAIFEVWGSPRREPTVLKLERSEGARSDAALLVDLKIDALGIQLIDEAENIGGGCVDELVAEGSKDLVFSGERLIDPRLKGVLIR